MYLVKIHMLATTNVARAKVEGGRNEEGGGRRRRAPSYIMQRERLQRVGGPPSLPRECSDLLIFGRKIKFSFRCLLVVGNTSTGRFNRSGISCGHSTQPGTQINSRWPCRQAVRQPGRLFSGSLTKDKASPVASVGRLVVRSSVDG